MGLVQLNYKVDNRWPS